MAELAVAEDLSEEHRTCRRGLARDAFALPVFAGRQPFPAACRIPHIHMGHKLACMLYLPGRSAPDTALSTGKAEALVRDGIRVRDFALDLEVPFAQDEFRRVLGVRGLRE